MDEAHASASKYSAFLYEPVCGPSEVLLLCLWPGSTGRRIALPENDNVVALRQTMKLPMAEHVPIPGGNVATDVVADVFAELFESAILGWVQASNFIAITEYVCQMDVFTSKRIHTVPLIFYNFIDDEWYGASFEERVKAKYGASKALQGNDEFNGNYFVCFTYPSRTGILQTLEALGQYATIPWIRAMIWKRLVRGRELLLRVKLDDAIVVGRLEYHGFSDYAIAYRRMVVLDDNRSKRSLNIMRGLPL